MGTYIRVYAKDEIEGVEKSIVAFKNSVADIMRMISGVPNMESFITKIEECFKPVNDYIDTNHPSYVDDKLKSLLYEAYGKAEGYYNAITLILRDNNLLDNEISSYLGKIGTHFRCLKIIIDYSGDYAEVEVQSDPSKRKFISKLAFLMVFLSFIALFVLKSDSDCIGDSEDISSSYSSDSEDSYFDVIMDYASSLNLLEQTPLEVPTSFFKESIDADVDIDDDDIAHVYIVSFYMKDDGSFETRIRVCIGDYDKDNVYNFIIRYDGADYELVRVDELVSDNGLA